MAGYLFTAVHIILYTKTAIFEVSLGLSPWYLVDAVKMIFYYV